MLAMVRISPTKMTIPAPAKDTVVKVSQSLQFEEEATAPPTTPRAPATRIVMIITRRISKNNFMLLQLQLLSYKDYYNNLSLPKMISTKLGIIKLGLGLAPLLCLYHVNKDRP